MPFLFIFKRTFCTLFHALCNIWIMKYSSVSQFFSVLTRYGGTHNREKSRYARFIPIS